jgi:flagellar hook-associated protein 1 FlgK
MQLVLDNTSYDLYTTTTNYNIIINNNLGNYQFIGGKLGALIDIYNNYIPALRNEINSTITEIIRDINHVQATGLGSSGEFTELQSSVPVYDINQPLNSLNLPFDIRIGTLTISVSDSNSSRINYIINIDPNNQSLNDIASVFSAIPGLMATVDATTGLLTIRSLPGYKFDFAGRDTIPPSNSGVTNTDTAGILSALEINPIFVGYDISNLSLSSEIDTNFARFSVGLTGYPGDNANINRFLSLRQQPLFSSDNVFSRMDRFIGNLGAAVAVSQKQSESANIQYDVTYKELQDIVGVSTNEEFTRLLIFQRLFQASSKYIATINNLFDSILQMDK